MYNSAGDGSSSTDVTTITPTAPATTTLEIMSSQTYMTDATTTLTITDTSSTHPPTFLPTTSPQECQSTGCDSVFIIVDIFILALPLISTRWSWLVFEW